MPCILTALVRAIRKVGSDWCLTFILRFKWKTYDLFQTVGVKFTRSLHSRLIYYAYSSLLMNRNLVTLSPIWKGEWGRGQVFIWSLAFCPQTCCPAWSSGSEQFHACWPSKALLSVQRTITVCLLMEFLVMGCNLIKIVSGKGGLYEHFISI